MWYKVTKNKAIKKKVVIKPTAQQNKALKRKTSFGVEFTRRKAIKTAKGRNGQAVAARAAGKTVFLSIRRFGSEAEAKIHGRRFTKIEGHVGFRVLLLKLKPNAWVNLKTKKTNPLIGAKRIDRR